MSATTLISRRKSSRTQEWRACNRRRVMGDQTLCQIRHRRSQWNSAHFCLHSAYPAMPRRGVSLPPSIFPPTRLFGAVRSAPRATEPPWVFHSHSAYRPSAARSPPRVVSSSSPAQLITYLRAFNIFTGKELWRERLPGGGQATPMTYISERSGRQFVVIVAGGHSGIGTTRGDSVVAFTLPKSSPRH